MSNPAHDRLCIISGCRCGEFVTILYPKLTSFCHVDPWNIQWLSIRPRHGVDHHPHKGEEHEEGHQARHGCQFVDCSHSSS